MRQGQAMKGNDDECRALVRRFYRMYRTLQKRNRLRHHMCAGMHGHCIEVWEYEGEKRVRCICRAKEANEIDCYKRAIKMLESYSGKERK